MKYESIEWNGEKYYRYPQSKRDKYFHRRKQTNLKRIRIYLHQETWEHYNGTIPKGYHIHHIDGDTRNNSIENLECLTPKEHVNKHPMVGDRLEKQLLHLDKIRILAKVWHNSDEGKEHCAKISKEFRDSPKGKGFHKRIAKLSYKNFKPIEKNCEQCGVKYMTKTHGNSNRFCSKSCVSKHRKLSGIDDIISICALCGNEFKKNKYVNKKYCSNDCRIKI